MNSIQYYNNGQFRVGWRNWGWTYINVLVQKKKKFFIFTYWEDVWDETINKWGQYSMYKVKTSELNENYDYTYNKYLEWLEDEPMISSCEIVQENKFLN